MSYWIQTHSPLFVGTIFVSAIAYWFVIVYGIGLLSGWGDLGHRFGFQGNFAGRKWTAQSVRLRFLAHYGNCVTLGASSAGLYLSLAFPFRIGHPNLLIPWSEITVMQGERGSLFKRRELHLGCTDSIPLRISSSLAQKLQTAAGPAWPHESVG